MRRSISGTKWCVALGVVLAVLSLAGPAVAGDDYVGTPPPDVGNIDSGGAGGGAVAGQRGNLAPEANESRDRGALALTGSPLGLLLFLAILAIGIGILLKRRADRPVT